MSSRPVCESKDHRFIPIIEVSVPLMRCVHCDVFAYHDTVKQLARNRSYGADFEARAIAPSISYWRRLWLSFRRRLGFAN